MGRNIAHFWTETEDNRGELFSVEQLRQLIGGGGGGVSRDEVEKMLLALKTKVEKEINDLTLYLTNDDPEEGEIGELLKIRSSLEKLAEEIEELRLFKFPNATIKGNPSINHGQISNFTQENYLILPSTFDVKGRGFEISVAFTTGADVTTPQNILGSQYCVALFVQAGKLNLRVSSDGRTWDIVNYQSQLTIEANKTYYIKIAFDRLRYKLSYSVNGEDYIEDGYVTVATEPYSGIIYIGVGNNFNNPFKGIINLNKWDIKFNNTIVWQGMDDVGLATRLATDLSNIDNVGLIVLDNIIADNEQVNEARESADIANQSILRQQGEISSLQGKVNELETSKDLGVIVIGTPTIHGSQVSDFSANNYLMMPRVIEFGNNPWQLDFQFTTGEDLITQQNLIDSQYGLALAVRNGRLVMALSSNGESFNLGEHEGSHTLNANTSYYVRITFDGAKYELLISTDRKTYASDVVATTSASLYPVQIYIGKSPNNSHIFTGSIYLYYAVLTINNEVVWTGTLGGELKDQVEELARETLELSTLKNKFVTNNTASIAQKGNSANGSHSSAFGVENIASGFASNAMGRETQATGDNSHAEGNKTKALGWNCHAEGDSTTAGGTGDKNNAHAEGHNTQAINLNAHAEGDETVASGFNAHAEGYKNQSIGNNSHTEGRENQAKGNKSHAEGEGNIANGEDSHAEGMGNTTTNTAEHASGCYNESHTGATDDEITLFSIGNGTNINRRNAFEVMRNGDIYIYKNGNRVKLQDLL